jgi:hypothetical protein
MLMIHTRYIYEYIFIYSNIQNEGTDDDSLGVRNMLIMLMITIYICIYTYLHEIYAYLLHTYVFKRIFFYIGS